MHHWNLTIRLFSVISGHSLGVGFLSHCRGAVGGFYSPSQLGKCYIEDTKWFQVLLSNTNYSIQHYSLVCTQLCDFNYYFWRGVYGATPMIGWSEDYLDRCSLKIVSVIKYVRQFTLVGVPTVYHINFGIKYLFYMRVDLIYFTIQ